MEKERGEGKGRERTGKGMGCSPGSSDSPGCRGARIVSEGQQF